MKEIRLTDAELLFIISELREDYGDEKEGCVFDLIQKLENKYFQTCNE